MTLINVKSASSTTIKQFLLPSLLEAPGYHIDQPAGVRIKLDQNESAFDCPEEIKEKILQRAKKLNWNRYPNPYDPELTTLVAQYAGVSPENILVAPGSNYLIGLLIECTSRLTDVSHVIATPSFPLYPAHASYVGAKAKLWPLNDKLEYDMNNLPPLTPKSVVVFASPNNPVGNVLPKNQLAMLLKKHPTALFIADEAYFEFANDPFTELLKDHDNLIIVRTFSKAFGAAGLRVGYIIAAKEWIEQFKKLQVPYMINHLTHAAMTTILSDTQMTSVFLGYVKSTIELRNKVYETLSPISAKKNFIIYPSQANFLLMRWPSQERCNQIYKSLIDHGIIVRNVSAGCGLGGCLRVSIGNHVQTSDFLQTIQSIV